MKLDLPKVAIGQRFTVDGLDRLPPVEFVRKLPTAWLVAEIRPDGTREQAAFRLPKDGLTGRTVRIHPADFRPEPGQGGLAVVPAKQGVPASAKERLLTAEEFHRLKAVPAEAQWFANISNAQTRRAFQNDVRRLMNFVGIERPEEFRQALLEFWASIRSITPSRTI